MAFRPGCQVFKGASRWSGEFARPKAPGTGDSDAADPVRVQQALFRFAGEFAAPMIFDIDELELPPAWGV